MEPELIRELRLLAEFVVSLPERVVGTIIAARESYSGWRERVRIQKEIAATREIGRALQHIYFFKGDIVAWARSMDLSDSQNIIYLRELFSEVICGLDNVRAVVEETAFSNTELATEAAAFIAKAATVYKRLEQLPDSDFRDPGLAGEIAAGVEKMSSAGGELVRRLDNERFMLDHIFS